MSPELANKTAIAIVEDYKPLADTLARSLTRAGYDVALMCFTREEALRAINEEFVLRDIRIALFDGNLDPTDTSGKDGDDMVKLKNEKAADVKTIGISAKPLKGVDANVTKGDLEEEGGLGLLKKTIKGLLAN